MAREETIKVKIDIGEAQGSLSNLQKQFDSIKKNGSNIVIGGKSGSSSIAKTTAQLRSLGDEIGRIDSSYSRSLQFMTNYIRNSKYSNNYGLYFTWHLYNR